MQPDNHSPGKCNDINLILASKKPITTGRTYWQTTTAEAREGPAGLRGRVSAVAGGPLANSHVATTAEEEHWGFLQSSPGIASHSSVVDSFLENTLAALVHSSVGEENWSSSVVDSSRGVQEECSVMVPKGANTIVKVPRQ